MMRRPKSTLLSSLLGILVVQSASIFAAPPAEIIMPTRALAEERTLPGTRLIHTGAGIYLNDQLKKYVYRRQRRDQAIQINIGKQLAGVSRLMSSSLFHDTLIVEALPPLAGNYGDDVRAVVKPEITYFGVSTTDMNDDFAGSVKAMVRMRVTIYDLDGKVLWRDEAWGEGTGGSVNPARGAEGHQEEMERIGYQALLSAASKIINDLNTQAPAQLYAALEPSELFVQKSTAGLTDTDLVGIYRERGEAELNRRNYHQALYWLNKSDRISPGDMLTSFYLGVCWVYVGQKSRGLEKFRQVIRNDPESQMGKDSAKWVETIRNPLKIGVVVIERGNRAKVLPADNVVYRTIKESRAYETVDVSDLKPTLDLTNREEFKGFLERCARKGLTLVVYVYTDRLEITGTHGGALEGDSAKDYITTATAHVFSTKKKRMHSQVSVQENSSVLIENTAEEREAIRNELLERASGRLVLKLLARDIL
ncbi:MAG: hypothetical protein A4E65_03803 [Syntrophorhabdus sp. PtaU1.Bin153]|nr:MAG: hypothetical protein A4E65_03803 [Syntrophorhabdus sp. PtaU1.Bin153]